MEWNLKNAMFVTIIFYEIKGRDHRLFNQGFDLVCKVMEFENQQCLGLFMLELNRHSEKLLRTIHPHKLTDKELSQLSLAPWLLLMLQINQGLQKWAPNQEIAKGLQ